MAASFVDTSALLKLYVTQAGSNWMSAHVRLGDITISELTTAEVGTSLIRRMRDGALSAHEAQLAWRRFRQDCRAFPVISVDRITVVRAVGVAGRSPVPLQTLDALQLQAALDAADDARSRGLSVPQFINADGRLEIAARALRFVTDNPLKHP